jgi:hypothetical protein
MVTKEASLLSKVLAVEAIEVLFGARGSNSWAEPPAHTKSKRRKDAVNLRTRFIGQSKRRKWF